MRRELPLVGVGVGVGVVAAVLAGWVAARSLSEAEPAVTAVLLSPATVQGCLPAEVTVTLDRPAPAGGLVVALTAPSGPVEVRPRLRFPAGATAANAPVTTTPVAVTERVALVAAVAGEDAPAGRAGPEAGARPGSGPGVAGVLEVTPVEAPTVSGPDPDRACLAGFTDLHGYTTPERVGMFDAELIPEASGLAASRRNPSWLYIVDDERPREVYAMRADGSELRAIPLEGFEGRDTEALAVGPCGPADPETCVYVGDIGDNTARYPDVAILRFAEPDLSAPVQPVVPDTIRVAYPDGPSDAEALLVDEAGTLYIVSKDAGPDGTGAAHLYATDGFAGGTLADLGPVVLPPADLPLVALLLGVLVTGGDYRDGRVVLRTYDAVFEFVAPGPHAPLAQFPSWPAREVPAAREPQSEAVAYAADTCGYYTVSERVGDIWFVDCRR